MASPPTGRPPGQRADVRVIDDAEIGFFRTHGYVVLRGMLSEAELGRLQRESAALIERARDGVPANDAQAGDFAYAPGHASRSPVLRRIEFVVERLPSCRLLAGHPGVLASVERLVGADLIPTWDSMVLKMPGEGIAVPWHRDAPVTQQGDHPIFNVDFYLDATEADTALWVLPGSQRLDDAAAAAEVVRRNRGDGFATDGATRVDMAPGDVLLHDILVLHGSPPSRGNALRRVVYFEYRAAHVELERGPHTPAYIPLKQQILVDCIEARRSAEPDEPAYRYAPGAPFDRFPAGPPATRRVPHAAYWRTS